MSKQLLAIVRGECHINQSARGKPAYTHLKGLMRYIAYGRYTGRLFAPSQEEVEPSRKQRGLWLDHNSKEQTHEEVLRWAKHKVHRYGYQYTYQLLLSTRYGSLTAGDFNRVLQQGSALSGIHEWRLMVHEDTANQHAHVILLRQKKLANSQYKEWQQHLQAGLERLQAERLQERQLVVEEALTIDAARALEGAWEPVLGQDGEVA